MRHSTSDVRYQLTYEKEVACYLSVYWALLEANRERREFSFVPLNFLNREAYEKQRLSMQWRTGAPGTRTVARSQKHSYY